MAEEIKKKKGRPENLKALTTEKAREIGKKGGIASGKAKKEKKLMSQIYAEFLEKEHNVQISEKVKKKMKGHELISLVSSDIICRRDSASVSLMKEIRESTEGSKHSVDLTSTEEAAKEIKQIFGAAMVNNGDK